MAALFFRVVRGAVPPPKAQRWHFAKESAPSKSHDVVAAVHVDYLSGDAAAAIGGEKQSGLAYLAYFDVAFQWSAFGVGFQHVPQSRDTARGERLDWPGGDGVDPNLLFAQIVGQIAHGGFESCLGHAHHVVVGHNFLAAVVGERSDAAALLGSHERSGGAGQRDERIHAHVMCDTEAFARGHQEIALEFFGRRKGNTVDQGVQKTIAFFEFGEEMVNLEVVRDIAAKGLGARQSGYQVLGFGFEPLILIGNRQPRARGLHGLRYAPGDAALVGHAENDGGASFHGLLHSELSRETSKDNKNCRIAAVCYSPAASAMAMGAGKGAVSGTMALTHATAYTNAIMAKAAERL